MENLKTLLESTENIVLYHGSNHDIDQFNLDFLGDGNDEHGVGIYLTNDKKVAKSYGEYTYEVVLDTDINEVPSIPPSKKLAKVLMKKAPDLEMTLTDWAENPDEAFENALNAMTDVDTMLEMLLNILADFYRDSPKQYLVNVVAYSGYDYHTVKFNNGIEYMVLYNPKKIESKRIVD